MTDDAVRRGAEIVLAPLVASLRAWGVSDAHWRPAPDGFPIVWLHTRTEFERVTLQAQAWLPAQARILLLRAGIPPEDVERVRLRVISGEGEATRIGE